jgi:hypothetical protein
VAWLPLEMTTTDGSKVVCVKSGEELLCEP